MRPKDIKDIMVELFIVAGELAIAFFIVWLLWLGNQYNIDPFLG